MKQRHHIKRQLRQRINWGTLFQIIIMLMAIVILLPPAWAEDDEAEIPFDVADIYFELNNTDGDLGIHALIDGEPWKRLTIENPRERNMLNIRVQGRLRKQGLTELFFESAEPTFDELSPEQFFRRFPEGIYEVEGITLEGDELESEAELTHLMPAPPDGISVSGTPVDPEEVDCDEGPVPVAAEPIIIQWAPVIESHPELGRSGEAVTVVKYQVVVEEEESESIVSIDLPFDATEIEIPATFIALGDQFKFEILVKEESGNQTAVESCFVVD